MRGPTSSVRVEAALWFPHPTNRPRVMLSRTLSRAATAAVQPALARAAVRPAAAAARVATALPSPLRTFSTSFARFEPSQFPSLPGSACLPVTAS